MHYSNYDDGYLKHKVFRVVRNVAFQKANWKCELCGAPAQDAHHRNRKIPVWGAFDTPENIMPLCRPCHAKIEGKDK